MILVGPSREKGLFCVRLCVVFWQMSSAKTQSPVQGCNLSFNLEQAIPRLKSTCFQGLLLLEETLSDGLPAEALSSARGELSFARVGPQNWWDVGSL